MSKRREKGEVVIKQRGAGFVGEELLIRISDDSFENVDWCMLSCGDKDCREFANVDVLNSDLLVIGQCCHVSECQMEDYEATR